MSDYTALVEALRRDAKLPKVSSLIVPELEDAADAIETLRRERDEARGCPHGDNCACAIGSRHFWLKAFCDERKRLNALSKAIKPFIPGAMDGIWGKWKAWIVGGAPTRDEGIAAAQKITKLQAALPPIEAHRKDLEEDAYQILRFNSGQ